MATKKESISKKTPEPFAEQVSITRTLLFVVPAAILTAVGLEQVLGWIEDPKKRLIELAEGPGPTSRRLPRPW